MKTLPSSEGLRALIYHDTPAGIGARSNLERRETKRAVFRSLKALSYFQLKGGR